MKKTLLLLIVLSISLTSCIDIIEEIHVNADKSGKVIWKVDLGIINDFAKAFLQDDAKELLKEVEQFPQQGVKKLSGIDGITNIQPIVSTGGSYGIEFNFKNQKSLNNAYYKLFNQEKKLLYPSLIKIKKNKVKRKNIGKVIDRLDLNMNNFSEQDKMDMVNVKSYIYLPREIKKHKNKTSQVSESNIIVQEFNLSEFLNGDVNTGNRIKF